MAQWNANGLHRHIEEIKIFLKYNHIDVLLISETHCTERTYCHIPQYKIYYTNHPDATAHAGTALIIRQSAIMNCQVFKKNSFKLRRLRCHYCHMS